MDLDNLALKGDLAKFHYLVQALDEDTALRVKDLIVKPPKDAYEALKERLLLSFKLTRQERASRILDHPELGDGKATKMADELMNYLEDDGADLLMREIFLRRLPQQVRAILEEDESSSLHQLAVQADRIRAQGMASLGLAARIADAEPNPVSAAVAARKMKKGGRKSKNPDWCWVHRRYGAKAWNCIKPCSYEMQENN